MLTLGDCLDPVTGMASLADASVAHVICDPPYAARAMKNARSSENIKERRDGKNYDFKYAALTNDVREAAADQFQRIARRWVLVFCDLESIAAWRGALESSGLRYVRTGIWVREGGAPQFSGDRPAQGAEACVIAHSAEERLRWNGGGRRAAWVGPIVNSPQERRRHKSPKPEWLMEQLVRDFTDRGELICDPFAGSGTTAVAAIRNGRRFVGWELAPEHHASASLRIEGTKEQLLLPELEPAAEQMRLGGAMTGRRVA